MVVMALLPTPVWAEASVSVSQTVATSLSPQPSQTAVVSQMDQRSGVDTTTFPPWLMQRTSLIGLSFSGAGLLAIGFGTYYVAVDGDTLAKDKINGKGVWVRNTAGLGGALMGLRRARGAPFGESEWPVATCT
jgi:hypothetical protein